MSTFNRSIPLVDNTAVVIPNGAAISYTHLSSITGHLQTFFTNPTSPLYHLVPHGSSIAISLPNSLEFVATFLATTTAGRVAAPLNPTYKRQELNFYLEDLNAKAIVVPRGTVQGGGGDELIKASQDNGVKIVEVWYSSQRERVEYTIYDSKTLNAIYHSENLPIFINYSALFPGNASPRDVALIIHTSGTTGRPKAVPLTHKNITQSMVNIAQNFSLTHRDKTYLVMPLFHVHGLIGALLSTLKTGGTAIIPQKFSASQFWNDFTTHGATWYSAVPTIHVILLNTAKPSPLPKIRFIRSCSSALAPDTFKKLESAFRAPVIESYGSSETSHCMTSNLLPQDGARKPGTVGAGLNVDVKIISDDCQFLPVGAIGEVVVKGDNVMSGYINNEKANKESFHEGYFRTGDQGFLAQDGFLTLTGRIKELINRGGEKISPIELDGVMLEHPEVAEAVSFGVDDAKYGQAVNAAVVLKSGSQLTEPQLQTWLKGKIATFKIPDKIFLVDALPKTATGKIQRRIIAQVFTKDHKPKL